MTASNPTPDDLRTIAENMKTEGQTSRAEILVNAAAKLEKYEGLKKRIRELLDVRLYLSEFYEKLKDLEQTNDHAS